ncbi:MAG: hypothetical protein KDD82_00745 [Planctomycetes bacterium]|nr:hypothetical protein [Planctomycetota bacterium]
MHDPNDSQSKHHLGVRDEGEISPPVEQRNADGSVAVVRWERVRKARRAIARGDYSDPRVLEQALESMLRSLGA